MENMRKEDDPDFELPCQLFNDDSEVEKMEKQRVRKLTAEDVLTYEQDLLAVLLDFIG
jgi:hypothetical protein